jgi:hypothetical protein
MAKPELARVVASSGFCCGMMLSPLLAELLSGDGADGAAFRPTLERRQNLSHHSADVVSPAGDRGFHRNPDFVVRDLGRQILAEHFGFGLFLIGAVFPSCL